MVFDERDAGVGVGVSRVGFEIANVLPGFSVVGRNGRCQRGSFSAVASSLCIGIVPNKKQIASRRNSTKRGRGLGSFQIGKRRGFAPRVAMKPS